MDLHIYTCRREIYHKVYLLFLKTLFKTCLAQRGLKNQIVIKNDFLTLNVYKGLLWITIYSIQVYYLYESVLVLHTKLLVSANLTWHLMIIIHHSSTGQRLFQTTHVVEGLDQNQNWLEKCQKCQYRFLQPIQETVFTEQF